MRTIGCGLAFGILGLLAGPAETWADNPGEPAERLRKATAVLTEMASGKQDTTIPREMTEKDIESLLKSETTLGGDASVTAGPKSLHDGANTDSRDVLLGGRYAVPAAGQAFVSALTTYSPPPKKR